jgi:ribokinase
VIAVVGSCNVDLVTYASRVPGPGETILGDRFVMGFGGKGANQAVMARRLGARTWMVGALGDDTYAEMTLANFAEQGVDATFVARVAGSSGVAPIWVEPDGTNRIIVVGGANDAVDPGVAVRAVEALEHVDAVIGQLEIPQGATAAAFGAARRRGAATILNPAPAAPLDDALVRSSDWLIPNEPELAALTAGASATDATIVELARRTGCRIVVTLGSEGAALLEADGSVARVPAAKVEPIDTAGAGDAFVGAFAYGLAAGYQAIDAVRLGVLCASDSVTRPGTQASFADGDRSRGFLDEVTSS